MPNYIYVSLQDDDRISVLTMDGETGKLTPKGELPLRRQRQKCLSRHIVSSKNLF